MPAARPLQAKEGDVLVLVGTMKGAFLFRSNGARARWDVSGPHLPGHSVYAMAWDGRAGRRRLWASTTSMHWGSVLRTSDDLGATWTNPEQANIKFPADTGLALANIWQIRTGPAQEPDVLWCGVEPASLFESRDAGETWELVRGLHDHPDRPRWEPGGGGLCLHTILPDPEDRARMLVAISTGGVYRTEDGGKSWRSRNQGVRAEFLPDKHPEFGQCVHKVVQNPKRPRTLFLQNHWGLYRSDDGGDHWSDIANGVPSDFGFPMVAHPHDPDVVYIVPLESDSFRATPEGKLRVYRTRDGGFTWEALTNGLPQQQAYETVLRDAMAADTLDPAGIYFGTRSGKLYGSADGGTSWSRLADGLPPITCVKTAVIGDPRKARVPRPALVKPARKVAKKKAVAKKAVPKKKAVAKKKAAPKKKGATRPKTATTATRRKR
ncbi:MAG: exo-alpha-sialidase [Candidatus Eisenbacteria bacterium]